MTGIYRNLPPNAKGVIWIVIGLASGTGIDICAKLVSEDIPVVNMMWMRGLILFCFLSVVVMFRGTREISTRKPLMHILRAFTWIGALFFTFLALRELSLAEANAFFMTEPLLMVPLAAIFLNESLNSRKVFAVVTGFIGVMVMLLPDVEDPTGNMIGIVYAVLSAFFFAAVSITIKKMVGTEGSLCMLYWPQVISIIALGPFVYANWVQPSLDDYMWISILSVFALLTSLCFFKAYSHGEASALAPAFFSVIPFAMLADLFIFDAVPGWILVAGASFVVGGVLMADMGKKKQEAE